MYIFICIQLPALGFVLDWFSLECSLADLKSTDCTS